MIGKPFPFSSPPYLLLHLILSHHAEIIWIKCINRTLLPEEYFLCRSSHLVCYVYNSIMCPAIPPKRVDLTIQKRIYDNLNVPESELRIINTFPGTFTCSVMTTGRPRPAPFATTNLICEPNVNILRYIYAAPRCMPLLHSQLLLMQILQEIIIPRKINASHRANVKYFHLMRVTYVYLMRYGSLSVFAFEFRSSYDYQNFMLNTLHLTKEGEKDFIKLRDTRRELRTRRPRHGGACMVIITCAYVGPPENGLRKRPTEAVKDKNHGSCTNTTYTHDHESLSYSEMTQTSARSVSPLTLLLATYSSESASTRLAACHASFQTDKPP